MGIITCGNLAMLPTYTPFSSFQPGLCSAFLPKNTLRQGLTSKFTMSPPRTGDLKPMLQAASCSLVLSPHFLGIAVAEVGACTREAGI